ncbi:MAG: NADH-quinone oxidoreductase subunit I [Planctomycetota bacterium]
MSSGRGIVGDVGSLVRGMGLTLRHCFQRPVTVRYPYEKLALPPKARAQLHNDIDDCIGCLQCARICPVECITIETVKAEAGEDLGSTTTGHKKRLHLTRFDIDLAKCCYCDLCTTVCPTECLAMTLRYENAVLNRDALLYHFSKISKDRREQLLAGGKK